MNTPDKAGCTPFRAACYYGHEEVVDYLLRCGEKGVSGVEDITSAPHMGEGEDITPLQAAAQRGHMGIVELIEAELTRRGVTAKEQDVGEFEEGEGSGCGHGSMEGVEGLNTEIENLPDDELLNLDG